MVVDILPSAMTGCTCYLGLPRAALVEILNESGCFPLMQALWHQGGGAWAGTNERDRHELALMADIRVCAVCLQLGVASAHRCLL